ALASESTALNFLGYDQFEDVLPGEVVAISMDGQVQRKRLLTKEQRPCMFEWVYFASPTSEIEGSPVYKARIELGKKMAISTDGQVQRKRLLTKEQRPCMFEWVYFASPTSEIEGSPVYKARIELGKKMAISVRERMKKDNIEFDIVVPVPETARIAAIALSEELKVPYREVLIKNRYINRTFILDSQDKREQAMHLKLAPVYSEIKGKRVLLVDDSIVRGTTSRKLIELVRMAGAKEVYFASTCPPIKHPCFYGIDFPMEKELLANNKSLQNLEEELSADGVIYQDIEALKDALFPKKNITPCMACLNKQYPTDIGGANELIQLRNEDRSAYK
ncbi:MAG: amidophosphoribosyltransferase, partial [Pseudobdellovibrionaceae bacterium]